MQAMLTWGHMDAFLTADGLLALATLTFLEIILGVDNVIYFAMGFSVFVEMINLRVRRTAAPVKLHQAYVQGERP